MKDERLFIKELNRAQTFIKLGRKVEYFKAYKQGLRRGYYGESAISLKQHNAYVKLLKSKKKTRKEDRKGIC